MCLYIKFSEYSYQCEVNVSKINWTDPSTFPTEPIDVIIGSELVYDKDILPILVPVIQCLLVEGGQMLYCCPDTDRAGMPEFVEVV